MYDFSKVKDYVDELHGNFKIPGCGVVVYKNGKKEFEYCAGHADKEGKVPATRDTRYFIYSCTKPVTVTAAMMLCERGLLSLDAPVSDYLPAYANAYLLVDGQRVKPAVTMTVRHLFTMSAGLDYNLGAPAIVARKQDPNAKTVDIVNSFVEAPLSFTPGDRFQYSLCHDVLGAIVEVVSGMRFGEFLKREIFLPLGMTHTGFDGAEDVAAQYNYSPDRGIVDRGQTNGYVLSPAYESGGAGLISTLDDYGKFAAMLASGGKAPDGRQIIKRETIDEMRREQLTSLVKNPSFGCAAGPGYGYGLGVRTLIDKSAGQRSPLGEFGWDGAVGAYLLVDVENGIGIAYVQHVGNWPQLCKQHPLHAPLRDGVYSAFDLT